MPVVTTLKKIWYLSTIARLLHFSSMTLFHKNCACANMCLVLHVLAAGMVSRLPLKEESVESIILVNNITILGSDDVSVLNRSLTTRLESFCLAQLTTRGESGTSNIRHSIAEYNI